MSNGSQSPIGVLLARLARAFAVLGGIVLIAMIALSVVSVGGRWLADSPIQGDFELVQLGGAICVACFLPYCQLRHGHIAVDFLTNGLPEARRRLLDAVGALLLGACATLLAWRLAVGAYSVGRAGETTMLLGVPIWWTYAVMAPAFLLLGAIGLHMGLGQLRLGRRH